MRPLLCPVLVGREDALAAVGEVVTRARSGNGGAVFVVGEAGTGKSRLATEARAMAQGAGLAVLTGRAVQRAAPPPYRPLAEALQPTVLRAGSSGDPEQHPGSRALRLLLPEAGQEVVGPVSWPWPRRWPGPSPPSERPAAV